jgi:hypothetical protein
MSGDRQGRILASIGLGQWPGRFFLPVEMIVAVGGLEKIDFDNPQVWR